MVRAVLTGGAGLIRAADISAAKPVLGSRPSASFEALLRTTLEWFSSAR